MRQLRQERQTETTAAKTAHKPRHSKENPIEERQGKPESGPYPNALPLFSLQSFLNFLNPFFNYSSFISQLFFPIPSRLYFHFPGFIQSFLPGGFQYVKRLYLLWCFLGKERKRGKPGGARIWGDEWGRGGETTLFSVHIVGIFSST